MERDQSRGPAALQQGRHGRAEQQQQDCLVHEREGVGDGDIDHHEDAQDERDEHEQRRGDEAEKSIHGWGTCGDGHEAVYAPCVGLLRAAPLLARVHVLLELLVVHLAHVLGVLKRGAIELLPVHLLQLHLLLHALRLGAPRL